MILITIVVSSQNFVNAAPRKKLGKSSSNSKVKRAATNNTLKKRAATSNKRTTSSSVSKRTVSRSISRTNKDVVTTDNVVDNKNKVSSVCPVGVFLKRKYDNERGEYTYYSSKTEECSLPEEDIVNVVIWDKENKSSYAKNLQVRPSWISEAETSFLTCVSGYVEKTVDKVNTCVRALDICPLGSIVEKSGKVYINPDTQEECMTPDKGIVRNVKGDENLLSYTLADEKAFIFECPANYYAVEDNETLIKVRCEMCPTGTSSPKGVSSLAECVDNSKSVEEPKVEVAVEETTTISEPVVDMKLLRIQQIGNSDDYTCINGWTNHWDDNSSSPKVMDKNGVIKNVVDRFAYGKNKVGCPIKEKQYLHVSGSIQTYLSVLDKNIEVRLGNYSGFYLGAGFRETLKGKLGILRYKMSSSDIDNTGVNGWTEEEFTKWNGYRPIIGYYYPESTCQNTSTHTCQVNFSGVDFRVFRNGGDFTAANLFTYWD